MTGQGVRVPLSHHSLGLLSTCAFGPRMESGAPLPRATGQGTSLSTVWRWAKGWLLRSPDWGLGSSSHFSAQSPRPPVCGPAAGRRLGPIPRPGDLAGGSGPGAPPPATSQPLLKLQEKSTLLPACPPHPGTQNAVSRFSHRASCVLGSSSEHPLECSLSKPLR